MNVPSLNGIVKWRAVVKSLDTIDDTLQDIRLTEPSAVAALATS